MKEYIFDCRSTPRGLKQWCSCLEDGVEVKRIDRDVQQETISQFRHRVSAELEAEGYVPAPNQYTL